MCSQLIISEGGLERPRTCNWHLKWRQPCWELCPWPVQSPGGSGAVILFYYGDYTSTNWFSVNEKHRSGLESGEPGPGSNLPFNSSVILDKSHNCSESQFSPQENERAGLSSGFCYFLSLTVAIRPQFGGEDKDCFFIRMIFSTVSYLATVHK